MRDHLLVFLVITAIPLVLFSYAAWRVEMTTMMGLMFLSEPDALCAVVVFGEPVTRWQHDRLCDDLAAIIRRQHPAGLARRAIGKRVKPV